MGRIVAVVNQKGGVGKTTTAVNLAAALAIAERPTLLVDADPQANSTRALGFEEQPDQATLYDLLAGRADVDAIRLSCEALPYLSVLPANRDLVGLEVELVDQDDREYFLKRVLRPVAGLYDHVILDCPPSLGLLTLNALAASDAVLIPVQCEYLALEGISQLVDTIERVREVLNPALEIAGVVMTMYDERTNLSRQVVSEVRGVFGDRVYRTVIPRNIRLGEAPSHGQPIFLYDIRSKGSEAYLELAREFVKHEAESTRQGTEESDPAGTVIQAATEGSADDVDHAAGRPDGEHGSRSPIDRYRPDPA